MGRRRFARVYLAPGIAGDGDGDDGSRRSEPDGVGDGAHPLRSDVVVGEVHADAHARERSSRVGVGQRRREGERVVVVESPPAKRAPTAVFDAPPNASRTKSARLLTRRRPSSAASEAEDTDGLFASAISLSGHPPRVESAAASAATPRSETSLERRLMDSRDGDASLAARAAASASAAPSSRPQPPRLSLLSRVVFLASARASAAVPPPSVTGSSSPRSGMSLAATPVSAMCTPSRGLSTRQSSSTAHRSFMRKSASASAPPEHTSAPVRFSVTVGRVEREDRVARRSHRRGPVQGPPLEAESLRAVRRDARADSLHSLRGCEGIPALTPPRGLRRPPLGSIALAPPKLVLVILPRRCEFVDGARHSVMR